MLMAIFKRELLVSVRQGSELLTPLWFFLLVITLFPLAIGPDSRLLMTIAPAIIWVALLLASLLALDRLFKDDYSDGALEQLLLLPQPLALIVLVKVIVHWLLTCLPILLLLPLAGLLLSLSVNQAAVLFITLLMGSVTISFIGAIGAALTFTLRRGGALLSLLILPLYIPVLIFSMLAIEMHALASYWPLLLALATGSMTLAPWVIAVILRISLE